MTEWYLQTNRMLREIRKKARDALENLQNKNDKAAKIINEYLKADYSSLDSHWSTKFSSKELGYLGRHIHFGMEQDYKDILGRDLPEIESKADAHLSDGAKSETTIGFEYLLHPAVIESACQQYKHGHLRDAVLNSVIAVFDLIRTKTGLSDDGERLVGRALSQQDPYLVLSNLESESGINDQVGFLQIYLGAYKGIRNPKAHSLTHDLDEIKAGQYLIFSSLLARRIDEAHIVKRHEKARNKET